MAQHEEDREDLIREAIALHPRVEWRVPGEPELVFCGFKRNGNLSIYFGQNPVYQFDDEGRLRRAWVDWCLFRSEGDTLAQLQRERSATNTTLVRRDLTPDQIASFLVTMRQRVARLLDHIRSQQVETVRSVGEVAPDEFAEALGRVLQTEEPLSPSLVVRR